MTTLKPVPYHANPERKRFAERGGDLDRIIYETGARMVSERIVDPNEIKFYTLTDEEQRKVFSEIADRLVVGNSPFNHVYERHLGQRNHGAAGIIGYETIIALYEKAQNNVGLKKFAIDLYQRGFTDLADSIIEKLIPGVIKKAKINVVKEFLAEVKDTPDNC